MKWVSSLALGTARDAPLQHCCPEACNNVPRQLRDFHCFRGKVLVRNVHGVNGVVWPRRCRLVLCGAVLAALPKKQQHKKSQLDGWKVARTRWFVWWLRRSLLKPHPSYTEVPGTHLQSWLGVRQGFVETPAVAILPRSKCLFAAKPPLAMHQAGQCILCNYVTLSFTQLLGRNKQVNNP